jgi:hypothetical protein
VNCVPLMTIVTLPLLPPLVTLMSLMLKVGSVAVSE